MAKRHYGTYALGTKPEGGDGTAPKAAGEEVVIRAPVHCDGCGRKLRRSLERLDWVGEVSVDSNTNTVVMRGPKVVENPAETVKIVEKRTRRKAVLLSPAPEKLPPPAVKETKKDDGNKDMYELPEINMKMVVILRINLHCDACCEEIKRRILRIKGVEDAVPHLKSSQVMVKGVVEPATLVGFIRNCTGRKAAIFRAEPLDPLPAPKSPPPEAETKKDGPTDNTGEKKDAQENGKNEEPREEEEKGGGEPEEDKKRTGDDDRAAAEELHQEAHAGEGEKHAATGDGVVLEDQKKDDRLFAAPLPAGVFTVAPETMAISNVTPYHHYSYPSSYYAYAHPSYYYQCQYPQPYYPAYSYACGHGMYGYPPEAFTEENPNACAIV
ncbi:hypothetical protein SETIT_2G108800v2 [Setaria italica]|uniref:HMA domain-containing protein n=2 Tax=Setaria italica TaxID=4555 RepID=A0A368PXD2_SETIT|nr:heavy metal-associated isoprenylated plant protein 7 [Setaria italica]RCV10395.1 hypothetical protein SETIT_2G108800v2 [Setaria italica]